jgi:hypothetical protein
MIGTTGKKEADDLIRDLCMTLGSRDPSIALNALANVVGFAMLESTHLDTLPGLQASFNKQLQRVLASNPSNPRKEIH